MKPLIGITVSLDAGVRLRKDVHYAYLKRSYGRAVARAGGVPVLLVPDAAAEDVAAACDGLVVSGGDDLPARLGADGSVSAPRAHGSQPELRERIAWERALIDAAEARSRPLLAVCYGMQLLNLHLGGTLHESFESEVDHGGGGRLVAHRIRTCGRHPAWHGLAAEPSVASSHRQCVDRVAPGLEILAEAPDGVVEAVGAGDRLGVEWHPEEDGTADAIYGWLVERARAR